MDTSTALQLIFSGVALGLFFGVLDYLAGSPIHRSGVAFLTGLRDWLFASGHTEALLREELATLKGELRRRNLSIEQLETSLKSQREFAVRARAIIGMLEFTHDELREDDALKKILMFACQQAGGKIVISQHTIQNYKRGVHGLQWQNTPDGSIELRAIENR